MEYGKIDGKFYMEAQGIVVERDPYYLDYCVRFADGTEDWFLPKYLRKITINGRKGNLKNEN